MDVVDWLRQIGLEQYAGLFADHDISAEILPNLTAGDADLDQGFWRWQARWVAYPVAAILDRARAIKRPLVASNGRLIATLR